MIMRILFTLLVWFALSYSEVLAATLVVKDFTHYHCYFPKTLSNNNYNKEIKLTHKQSRNTTQDWIDKLIDRCPNPHYYPRVVTSNQISWKKVERHASKSQPKNTTVDISHTNDNNTDADKIDEIEDSNTVVHEYMAFALLIPHHPFSADLASALRIVMPMFPSIKLVVGNGHDFKSLCSQYGVSSFPQLLLFTKGLLRGKYHYDIKPHILAEELAVWTSSFPKALPNVSPAPPGFHQPAKKASIYNKTKDYFIGFFNTLIDSTSRLVYSAGACLSDIYRQALEGQLPVLLTQFVANTRSALTALTLDLQALSSDPMALLPQLLARLTRPLHLPHSLEPVKGSLDDTWTEWDRNGYLVLLSGGYVLGRAVYGIVKLLSRDRQP